MSYSTNTESNDECRNKIEKSIKLLEIKKKNGIHFLTLKQQTVGQGNNQVYEPRNSRSNCKETPVCPKGYLDTLGHYSSKPQWMLKRLPVKKLTGF